MASTLTIPANFCGPPGAGNGGYVCGRLAGLAEGTIEVTLRRAVPLGRPLAFTGSAAGGWWLRDDDTLLAEALAIDLHVDPPSFRSFAAAEEAAKRHPRFVDHPVPHCFVCGPERTAGDGLRLFPGPLPQSEVWAAPWVPDASFGDQRGVVPAEIVWAALDCPGAFAVNEPPRGLALLGRLAARIDAPVRVGERCVVLSWPLGRDGRKLQAGTAVFGERGDLRAAARATWVLTSPST